MEQLRFSPRFAILAVVLAGACFPSPTRAGAAVEGIVALPEAIPPPLANPRYRVKTAGVIGPPDPPAAVVFLDTGARSAHTTAPKSAMAQHHYQFAPGLLAVERGTLIAFPNLDDEYHSVFSYSKPKRFDLGRYRKDEQPAELVFDEPGLVKLFCEIHDHMRGRVLVLDTPYFAKTSPDGRYRLENLPAGRRVLKAWVDDDVVRERAVDLVDGETSRVDFP
jgi:plastocyanin